MITEIAKVVVGLSALGGVTFMTLNGTLSADAAIGIYGTVLGYVFGKGVATAETHAFAIGKHETR